MKNTVKNLISEYVFTDIISEYDASEWEEQYLPNKNNDLKWSLYHLYRQFETAYTFDILDVFEVTKKLFVNEFGVDPSEFINNAIVYFGVDDLSQLPNYEQWVEFCNPSAQ